MKSTYLLLAVVMMIIIVPQVSAFEWCEWIPFWDCAEPILLQDYTTYDPISNICEATRGGMQVDISPCNVQDVDGKNIQQFVNFKWDGVNTKNISWVFMYPNDIASGKIEVLMNVTEDYETIGYENMWGSKIFTNITGSLNLGTPDNSCEFGNQNNTQMYQIEQYNNQTLIICFSNFENLGGGSYRASGNYDKQITIVQQRTVERWVDKTNMINFLGYNLNVQGYYYYQVYSVRFDPGKEYQTRWTYTPKDSKIRGKWNILGYETETGLMNAIENNQYIFVDPWWNNSWNYKQQVSDLTGEYPSFNITYNGNMNSDFSDLRFLNLSENDELNFTLREKVDGAWAYVTVDTNNESSIYMYYGNPTALSTSSVNDTFLYPSHYYDYDAGNLSDQIHNADLNNSGASETSGYVLSGFDFTPNDYMSASTLSGFSTGSTPRTLIMWVNSDDVSNFREFFTYGTESANAFFAFRQNNDGEIWAQNGALAFSSGAYLNTSVWTMVTAIYDGTNFKMYKDSQKFFDSAETFNTGTTNNPYIGSYLGAAEFWDGKIDEIYFYTKALTDDDVAELNSMGNLSATFGAEELRSTLNITLLYPENNYKSTSNSIDFSCLCEANGGCLSLNMTIDGFVVNTTTNTSIAQNLSLTYSNNSIPDGDYQWFCTASNSNEDSNSSIYSFTVDSTAPIVTITSPSDPHTVTQFNESVQINWTVLDANPDTCWYAYSDYDASLIMFNDSYSWTDTTGVGYLYGWIYVTDKDNQNITVRGRIDFGTNPYVRIYKNALTTTGDYQEFQVSTGAPFYDDEVPLNVSENGWHYFRLYAVDAGPFEQTFINEFTLNNPRTYPQGNTIVTCGANTSTVNYPFTNPINATYTLFANDTLSNINYDNVTLIKSTDAPQINISSPATSFVVLEAGDSVALNYSITNSTELSACWYQYNSVNTTITCNQNTTFSYASGINTITLFANDTLGNINSSTRSWSILVSLSSINYSDITFETKYEHFSINVTANSSVDSINGIFVYNGTNYSTTQQSIDGKTKLISQIDIPTFNETINTSLYFIINATSSSISSLGNSKSVNQTVQNITLEYCEGNYTANYINYTTKSATVPYPEVNTTFSSNWNYYLASGTGTVTKTLGYEDLAEDNSQYNFCFSRPDQPIIVSNSIEVNANGYSESSSFLSSATLSNDTTQQDIFLLNESISFATVLEVYDQNGFPITDVTISALLYDVTNDTFFTVTQGVTSTIGTTLVYLNWLDSTYKFILVKDGEILQTTLPEVLYESPRVFTITEDFTYTYNKFLDIPYTLTFNNATNIFSLTFANPTGAYNEACLRVNKKAISGDTLICDTCQTASSGTITCNVDAYGNGTYQATFYATGSLQSIDWLVEVIGNTYSQTIAETIGNEDATLYAFLMGVMITGIMFVSPVLGIIGIIISVYISYLMGFILLDYIVLSSLIIIGGVIALIFNK